MEQSTSSRTTKVWIAVLVIAIVAVGLALRFGTPEPSDENVAVDDAASSEESESSPPPEIVWRAAQDAFLNENINQTGWTRTAEGLQYRVEQEAAEGAPRPAPGSEVTVHYEGRLINGQVFDSSYTRGEPATFSLGGVIPGWQIGVPMMREGEIWQFALPAALAYGERGAGPIPPGSTLLFKVELLEAKVPTAPN